MILPDLYSNPVSNKLYVIFTSKLSSIIFILSTSQYPDTLTTSNSRAYDIKSYTDSPKMQFSKFKCLPLGFIDGYCKTEAYWKLKSLKSKGNTCW